jgi:hypothetical protein
LARGRGPRARGTSTRLAALDAQIAALQSDRAALLAGSAPVAVAYDLDPTHPPTAAEAAQVRAAGEEVIQPAPGAPVVGQVVPEAEAEPPAKPERKK